MRLPKDLDLEGEMAVFRRPWTAIIPMITGPASALGSYLVIRELWGGRLAKSSLAMASTARRSSMRAPLARTLLAISFTDFVLSLGYGLSTIPLPRQVTYVPFAMGNFQTCDAQGFFLQYGGVAGPFYISLLTYFYLVIIKYQWTDVQIRKAEIWAHSAILVFSLACALFPIPMNLYNNTYQACWFAPYPKGCAQDPNVPCERGADFALFFVLFGVFPFWPCFLVASSMIYEVYRKVRKMEDAANQTHKNYAKSSAQANQDLQYEQETETDDTTNLTDGMQINRNRSRAVATQGFMFLMAFVVSNAMRCISIFSFAFTQKVNPTFLVLAVDVFQPLQGFFNAIVLLRTSTLHTPEGKFVQRGFNACWSFVACIGYLGASLCSLCWPQQAKHLGVVDSEQASRLEHSPTNESSRSPKKASSHHTSEEPKWNSGALEMFLNPDSVFIAGDHESYESSMFSSRPEASIAEIEQAAIDMLEEQGPLPPSSTEIGLRPSDALSSITDISASG